MLSFSCYSKGMIGTLILHSNDNDLGLVVKEKDGIYTILWFKVDPGDRLYACKEDFENMTGGDWLKIIS